MSRGWVCPEKVVCLGVPCDLSHDARDVPAPEQNDGQTSLKTLPSYKLRWWVVKKSKNENSCRVIIFNQLLTDRQPYPFNRDTLNSLQACFIVLVDFD